METGGDITEILRPYLRQRHAVSEDVLLRLIADWNQQGSFLDFLVDKRLLSSSVARTLEAVRKGALNLPIEAVLGLPIKPTVPDDRENVAVITPGKSVTPITLQSPQAEYVVKTPAADKPMVGMKVGRYVLQEKLGEGATTTVFRALDATSNTPVAIKLFAPLDELADPQAPARFQKEALTLIRLEHSHIVRVLDAEITGPYPYVVMEYVGETTLATQIRNLGRLPAPRIVQIGLAVAAALEAAGQAGFLHRDINPANIFERRDGHVKLANFGLVTRLQSAVDTSEPTDLAGTASYMAPEQVLRAADLDFRAAMYGLGATLYHAAVGRPPLVRATPDETMKAQVQDEPVPIWHLAPSFDIHVAATIHRLLRKNPAERFASWADLRAALGYVPVVEPAAPLVRNANGFFLRDSAETEEPEEETEEEQEQEKAERKEAEKIAAAESPAAFPAATPTPPLPALLSRATPSREPLFVWWTRLPPSRQTALVGGLLLLVLLSCIWFGMRTY